MNEVRLGKFYPVNFSFIKNFNEKSSWIWKNCGITIQRNNGKIRFIVRRQRRFPYTARDSNDNQYLRHMIYFDVSPDSITYEVNVDKDDNSKTKRAEIKCSILKIHNNRQVWHIWQWNDEIVGTNIIANMNEQIKNLNNNDSSFLIEGHDFKNNNMIPVIYHPARDSNPIDKIDEPNYLEEMHCHASGNKIEVTLVYAGERLRKHWFLHHVYKLIRLFGYQRTKDVESFYLLIDNNTITKIDFPKIYSKDTNIHDDDVHHNAIVDVMYYFDIKQHPAIFVNTANHAMAEYDTNPTRWKIEYIVWGKESPITCGQESREEIESRLRTLNYKIRT